MNSSHIFFLGGHDAEMEAIRTILEDQDLPFFDRGLSWGARLSDYADLLVSLPAGSVPVLVELEVDMPLPPGARVVDHHGPRAGASAPTSLEQVADLLGHTLTREEELISANDRGHTRAMLEFGATREEAARIRAMDRSAQRVTEEDDDAARQAVEHLFEPKPGLAVVKSAGESVTPVVDLLWERYKTLIVETRNQVFVTGPGSLIEALVAEAEAQSSREPNPIPSFWYGGPLPERGFFGTSRESLEEVLDQVLRLQPS